MSDPATSHAVLTTPNASRYLQQLCKHFQHKRPVSFDPRQGHIAFSQGTCALSADDDTLTLQLEALDADTMPQLQDVVARHLVRFAFREDLTVAWSA